MGYGLGVRVIGFMENIRSYSIVYYMVQLLGAINVIF